MTAAADQPVDDRPSPGRAAGEQTRRPPGTLVLLRNGQSEADDGQAFAGLLDPHLTEVGIAEAAAAATMLAAHGVEVDLLVTSPLARASRTAEVVARTLSVPREAVLTDDRLLPRGLGCLTGLAKRRALERYGHDAYLEWRYAVDGRPPPATVAQAAGWPWRPPGELVDDAALIAGESLRDVIGRVEPVWTQTVRPALAAGRGVLVVAHGDSLRAFRAVVEGLAGASLADGSITPAQPLLYVTGGDGHVVGPAQYVEDLARPPGAEPV